VGLRVASLPLALLVWEESSLMVGARFIPGPEATSVEPRRLIASGEVWGQLPITLERSGSPSPASAT
jgi:ABC-type nitrate/sulfonate/bicarbonate transport system permease component